MGDSSSHFTHPRGRGERSGCPPGLGRGSLALGTACAGGQARRTSSPPCSRRHHTSSLPSEFPGDRSDGRDPMPITSPNLSHPLQKTQGKEAAGHGQDTSPQSLSSHLHQGQLDMPASRGAGWRRKHPSTGGTTHYPLLSSFGSGFSHTPIITISLFRRALIHPSPYSLPAYPQAAVSILIWSQKPAPKS